MRRVSPGGGGWAGAQRGQCLTTSVVRKGHQVYRVCGVTRLYPKFCPVPSDTEYAQLRTSSPVAFKLKKKKLTNKNIIINDNSNKGEHEKPKYPSVYFHVCKSTVSFNPILFPVEEYFTGAQS